MKIKADSEISAEDIPSVTLGLLHKAKSLAAPTGGPQNSVEYTLSERSNEIFKRYITSMQKHLKESTEKI